jgi:hypothetical protein
MAVTLKEKHSLMGKSILPILMELKVAPMPAQLGLARLKKDHPLEHYKLEELQLEFKKLTGEELNNVLTLAGKATGSVDNAIHAMHLAILQVCNNCFVFSNHNKCNIFVCRPNYCKII